MAPVQDELIIALEKAARQLILSGNREKTLLAGVISTAVNDYRGGKIDELAKVVRDYVNSKV